MIKFDELSIFPDSITVRGKNKEYPKEFENYEEQVNLIRPTNNLPILFDFISVFINLIPRPRLRATRENAVRFFIAF